MSFFETTEGYCISLDGRQIKPYYRTLDGKEVERTPQTHPYSYDAFVIFQADDYNETDSWVYSDRMLQWDREAFTNAVSRVWPDKAGSQMFHGRDPKDLNHFLNLYFTKEVKLTAVQQGCNVSNGYPYWIFCYRDVV